MALVRRVLAMLGAHRRSRRAGGGGPAVRPEPGRDRGPELQDRELCLQARVAGGGDRARARGRERSASGLRARRGDRAVPASPAPGVTAPFRGVACRLALCLALLCLWFPMPSRLIPSCRVAPVHPAGGRRRRHRSDHDAPPITLTDARGSSAGLLCARGRGKSRARSRLVPTGCRHRSRCRHPAGSSKLDPGDPRRGRSVPADGWHLPWLPAVSTSNA